MASTFAGRLEHRGAKGSAEHRYDLPRRRDLSQSGPMPLTVNAGWIASGSMWIAPVTATPGSACLHSGRQQQTHRRRVAGGSSPCRGSD
jgi:hypothetical protein